MKKRMFKQEYYQSEGEYLRDADSRGVARERRTPDPSHSRGWSPPPLIFSCLRP